MSHQRMLNHLVVELISKINKIKKSPCNLKNFKMMLNQGYHRLRKILNQKRVEKDHQIQKQKLLLRQILKQNHLRPLTHKPKLPPR